MKDDALAAKVARLSVVSAEREAERSSRLRRDANECGFTSYYRDLQRHFGAGTRIVYFRGRDGSYGERPPAGVPASVGDGNVIKVKRA